MIACWVLKTVLVAGEGTQKPVRFRELCKGEGKVGWLLEMKRKIREKRLGYRSWCNSVGGNALIVLPMKSSKIHIAHSLF